MKLGNCFPRGNRTFERWVDLIVREHRCDNQHWIPLTKRYQMKTWNNMNFMGKIENLEDDARELLQRIGAWEKYGKTGWGPQGTSPVFHRDLPPEEEQAEEHELAAKEGRGHETNAHSNLVGYYAFRPEQFRLVTEYYKDDYAFELMGYDVPDFSHLNLTGIEKMGPHGCF